MHSLPQKLQVSTFLELEIILHGAERGIQVSTDAEYS